MIPRKIHYIWLGGESNLTAMSARCIATWKKYLTEFELVFWNEQNIKDHFDTASLLFPQRMISRKKYAFAADYIRCLVLEKYGGVYLDTDIEVLRDLSPLLHYPAFLGLEDINRPGCGILGAAAKTPFITELKNAVKQAGGMVEIPRLAWQILSAGENITMDYSEPAFIHSVCVFPERYFYPYNPYKNNKLKQLLYSDVTPDTFVIHHWEKSWKLSFTERVMKRIKDKLYK